MDRQRSFSLKATRLFVFSFTISSSIFFIILFTIWVIKSTPSVPQQIPFQFNTSSLTLGLKPASTAQTLAGFSTNSSASEVKDSILITTHFRKYENASGISGISAFSGHPRENGESQVLEDEERDEVVGFTGDEKVVILSREKIEEKNASETLFKEVVVQEKSEEPTAFEKRDLVSSVERVEEKRRGKCDVTRGRWVYEESYPLYTNASCPFIDEGFNCQANGRPDKEYMKLRWQPQDCDTPRYFF